MSDCYGTYCRFSDGCQWNRLLLVQRGVDGRFINQREVITCNVCTIGRAMPSWHGTACLSYSTIRPDRHQLIMWHRTKISQSAKPNAYLNLLNYTCAFVVNRYDFLDICRAHKEPKTNTNNLSINNIILIELNLLFILFIIINAIQSVKIPLEFGVVADGFSEESLRILRGRGEVNGEEKNLKESN